MRETKKEKTAPPATEEAPARRSRRQAIALAGAAAAGAAVVAVGVGRGKEAHAATGDLMKVGEYHEATPGDTTQLVGEVHPGPVLALRNDAEPPEEKWNAVALSAQSREGVAVVGTTFGPEDGGYGTRGLSYIGSPETPPEEWLPGPGIGVGGMSGSGSGVRGTSESGPGVSAESQSGPGVAGTSKTGHGVEGATTGIPSPPTYPAGVVGVSYRPGAPPGVNRP